MPVHARDEGLVWGQPAVAATPAINSSSRATQQQSRQQQLEHQERSLMSHRPEIAQRTGRRQAPGSTPAAEQHTGSDQAAPALVATDAAAAAAASRTTAAVVARASGSSAPGQARHKRAFAEVQQQHLARNKHQLDEGLGSAVAATAGANAAAAAVPEREGGNTSSAALPAGDSHHQQQLLPMSGGYDAAAITRLIKHEPQNDPAAAAAGGIMPGPAAAALLREATAAGFPLPNQQQMQHFLLADRAFSAGELLRLYGVHLVCAFPTKPVARANRSGAIREAVVGNAVPCSRMEHQHQQLAPGFLRLRDAVPQLKRGLLQPQQQQHEQQAAAGAAQPVGRRANQRPKVSEPTGAAAWEAAATAAGITETPATSRLLLALRSFEQWQVDRCREPQLPALLQLLLFGEPQAPAAGGVAEVIDLVAAEEDEELQQQMMQQDGEELLVTREVQQQQPAGGKEGASSRGGGGVGGSRVKREPGV